MNRILTILAIILIGGAGSYIYFKNSGKSNLETRSISSLAIYL